MTRRQVTLSGVERKVVAYEGVDGQVKGPFEDGTPHKVPAGTVTRRIATLLEDVVTLEGEQLPGGHLLLEVGSREFLRGRVVEGAEAKQLLIPPEIRQVQAMFGGSVDVVMVGGGEEDLRVVAITESDGIEVALALRDGDVPPPAGVSTYPVGESPEEVAAAGVVDDLEDPRRHCPNCLTAHLPPGLGITAEEAAEVAEQRLREAEGGGLDFVDDDDDLEDEDIDDEAELVEEEDPRETGGEGGN